MYDQDPPPKRGPFHWLIGQSFESVVSPHTAKLKKDKSNLNIMQSYYKHRAAAVDEQIALWTEEIEKSDTELGSVDKGRYPEFDGSDGEEAEERQGGFVVAGGDAAELLDLVEHALDPVPVPILPVVAGRRVPAVRLGRNDGQDALDEQAVPDIVTVISLVGDHGFGLAYIQIDQIGDGLEVRGFATGQREAERASLTVCAGVDLARKAAAASTKTLLASPPFAPAAWL